MFLRHISRWEIKWKPQAKWMPMKVMSSLNRRHCFCCLCCNFVPNSIFASAYCLLNRRPNEINMETDRESQIKNQSHSHRSANQWKLGSRLCYDKWNNNLPDIYIGFVCTFVDTHRCIPYTHPYHIIPSNEINDFWRNKTASTWKVNLFSSNQATERSHLN